MITNVSFRKAECGDFVWKWGQVGSDGTNLGDFEAGQLPRSFMSPS